jgi:hypothetical protein
LYKLYPITIIEIYIKFVFIVHYKHFTKQSTPPQKKTHPHPPPKKSHKNKR